MEATTTNFAEPVQETQPLIQTANTKSEALVQEKVVPEETKTEVADEEVDDAGELESDSSEIESESEEEMVQ